LAKQLGVTRPTLREALQRLARDGWLEIKQGKPTRIRDYWHEGKLGVLDALSGHLEYLPENFITNLLNTRLSMAPTYTALAIDQAPQEVENLLDDRYSLGDSPMTYSQFDWMLQQELTILGQNPVFVMILNGFKDIFLNLAPVYFSLPAARQASLNYYNDLAQAANNRDSDLARNLTEVIMKDSIAFWQRTKLSMIKDWRKR
jgi:GntR family negative regulator for fad regulon and positive regulator of fabA